MSMLHELHEETLLLHHSVFSPPSFLCKSQQVVLNVRNPVKSMGGKMKKKERKKFPCQRKSIFSWCHILTEKPTWATVLLFEVNGLVSVEVAQLPIKCFHWKFHLCFCLLNWYYTGNVSSCTSLSKSRWIKMVTGYILLDQPLMHI